MVHKEIYLIQQVGISKTDWGDSNWKVEYKAYTSDKKNLELLENGPKSLSQSLILQELHQTWMKLKGY